jgi:hypothetical protein
MATFRPACDRARRINAGYDEITHIYFAMMEAMPDDVVTTLERK